VVFISFPSSEMCCRIVEGKRERTMGKRYILTLRITTPFRAEIHFVGFVSDIKNSLPTPMNLQTMLGKIRTKQLDLIYVRCSRDINLRNNDVRIRSGIHTQEKLSHIEFFWSFSMPRKNMKKGLNSCSIPQIHSSIPIIIFIKGLDGIKNTRGREREMLRRFVNSQERSSHQSILLETAFHES
jgi:hypothetical protein